MMFLLAVREQDVDGSFKNLNCVAFAGVFAPLQRFARSLFQ